MSSTAAMDCDLSHETFPASRKRPVSECSELQVDHSLPLPSLSTATVEDVYKLLLLAEEQHLMRLRHYCEVRRKVVDPKLVSPEMRKSSHQYFGTLSGHSRPNKETCDRHPLITLMPKSFRL
ncbi:ANK2 [Symbiodinium sp. CCMP2592]|nr:ANK2 [Symbiodinium sp. CCMP2592]